MTDVNCIVINYNTTQYTIDCIESIINNTKSDLNYNIIIVDNASSQNSYNELKQYISTKNDKRLIFVRSKQNVGFGAGNMIGVQHAPPCKYYAFINNDTLQISDDCLLNLKSFMEAHPQVGVCSPQMLNKDKGFMKTIDHFSSLQREIIGRSVLEFLFPKKYLNRKIKYQKPTKAQYVQGAFLFVDAKEFNDIGGFDTNLFLYYEESDLCRRLLKQKEKETYLIPQLEYIHYQSASTKSSLLMKMEQKLSLIYYIRKHHSWLHYKILLAYFSVRYFITSIFKPKYWPLFIFFLTGAPLSRSLKQKQLIFEDDTLSVN